MTMKAKALPLAVLVLALVALAGTLAYAVDRSGGIGSMHRSGYWMMGPSGQRSAWYLDGSEPVRDFAGARARAQRFADRLGLKTGEVMQFSNNFYARLDDRDGRPATEVLVDPRDGAVTLEYGAAMMWNARYGVMTRSSAGMMGRAGGGMMAGGAQMMGGSGGGMMSSARGSGPVDAVAARVVADRWLASQRGGERADAPEAFPGYFTMETRREGKVAGMVSVNARTGALIYHWWHGPFVASEE